MGESRVLLRKRGSEGQVIVGIPDVPHVSTERIKLRLGEHRTESAHEFRIHEKVVLIVKDSDFLFNFFGEMPVSNIGFVRDDVVETLTRLLRHLVDQRKDHLLHVIDDRVVAGLAQPPVVKVARKNLVISYFVCHQQRVLDRRRHRGPNAVVDFEITNVKPPVHVREVFVFQHASSTLR